jgi:hypothetical protein
MQRIRPEKYPKTRIFRFPENEAEDEVIEARQAAVERERERRVFITHSLNNEPSWMTGSSR